MDVPFHPTLPGTGRETPAHHRARGENRSAGHGAGELANAIFVSSFQLLVEFYRQQEQIRELREELEQKDVSDPPAEATDPVESVS